MPNLLNNLNERANEYEGKRLTRLLIILFAIFLILGLSVGAVIGRFSDVEDPQNTEENVESKTEDSYEGVVTYIEPFLYEADGISYVLADSSGNDVILLKSKDQKLAVSEGHFATVYGKVRKTINKEDYLLVTKVVIKNAPN